MVFVVALLLRLPSCYESFWLDELHTAWAIWEDLTDVAPRAEVGNQTPLYFQLMWLWKQLAGQSEVALRLSSVLAVSLASALLVIAVCKTSKRLAAGILSGLVLAVESNAIFFGTELRAYAWLMPLTVIALWSGVERLSGQSIGQARCLTTRAGGGCLSRSLVASHVNRDPRFVGNTAICRPAVRLDPPVESVPPIPSFGHCLPVDLGGDGLVLDSLDGSRFVATTRFLESVRAGDIGKPTVDDLAMAADRGSSAGTWPADCWEEELA